MRFSFGALFFYCICVAFGPISQADQGEIRIRLTRSLHSIHIKGVHLEILVKDQRVRPLIPSESSEVQVEFGHPKHKNQWAVRWNGEPTFKYYAGESLELSGVSLRQGSLSLPRKVQFVLGSGQHGSFDLVSSLDLETYLMGVLPKEMPASWPVEALKAQTVAARSYAIYKMKERKASKFDIEASISDQAFEFSPVQYEKSKWSDKVQRIIRSTKGQILESHHKVIKAFYHSDCGGKTEKASDVWGYRQGYNGLVQSCFHPLSKSGTWSFEINRELLIEKVKKFFSIDTNFDLLEIRVGSFSSSGRVQSLSFNFSNKNYSISAQDLRRIVGYSKIKSTLFKFQDLKERLIFKGLGNGHGVGMCQYGARSMAEAGKSYIEILQKYFPSAELKSLKFEKKDRLDLSRADL